MNRQLWTQALEVRRELDELERQIGNTSLRSFLSGLDKHSDERAEETIQNLRRAIRILERDRFRN